MHDNADFNDSYDSISMVPDEIIDFLKSIEDDHQPSRGRQNTGIRSGQQNLRQKFLEHLCENPKTEQKYFTMLGELLIEKYAGNQFSDNNDEKKAMNELNDFLQKNN